MLNWLPQLTVGRPSAPPFKSVTPPRNSSHLLSYHRPPSAPLPSTALFNSPEAHEIKLGHRSEFHSCWFFSAGQIVPAFWRIIWTNYCSYLAWRDMVNAECWFKIFACFVTLDSLSSFDVFCLLTLTTLCYSFQLFYSMCLGEGSLGTRKITRWVI